MNQREKSWSPAVDPQIMQLIVAATAIENILSDLAVAEESNICKDANSNETCRRAEISDPTKQDHNSVQPITPSDSSISAKKAICFDDVVGNHEAKQALYENVVLPLTINNETKVKIFSGSYNTISYSIYFQH